jgi:hypothetical protein
MSVILATAVGLCFVWSVFLFFAAVFVRSRDQEDGFGWALGGAALFLIVFSDRLPGHPTGLRDVANLLPGVSGSTLFTSSLVALIALFVLYLFRIAVFYELLVREGGATENSDEELANDIVAPAMSYFCFATCLVALLEPMYGLGMIGGLLLLVALVLAYYAGLLPRLLHFLQDFWTEIKILGARLRLGFERTVLEGVVLIAKAEDMRRGEGSNAFGKRAEARVARIKEKQDTAKGLRKSLITKAAQTHVGKPGNEERTSR